MDYLRVGKHLIVPTRFEQSEMRSCIAYLIHGRVIRSDNPEQPINGEIRFFLILSYTQYAVLNDAGELGVETSMHLTRHRRLEVLTTRVLDEFIKDRQDSA